MIGIIGGSGLYELFEPERAVEPETPYGPASAPIALATVGGVPTAFLPRHGLGHQLPPHRIPYRANLWALRSVGVTRIVAPCASGSLRADLPPGTFVVCDQFVDRTSGREHTFYDGPDVRHVSAADPYCPDMRRTLLSRRPRAGRADARRRDGGRRRGPALLDARRKRLVPVHGLGRGQHDRLPRGLARARARPVLRERLLITDYDVGVAGDDAHAAVTAQAVVETFAANIERLRGLLVRAVTRFGEAAPDDPCPRALDDAAL